MDGYVEPFNSDDLYNILIANGKQLPLSTDIIEKGVTSQRAGSCTVINACAIARMQGLSI